MGEITFHKMVASGNDFIVIDNRNGAVKNAKELAAKICRPHLGVGADGVLLIEPSRKADFFLRIFNADGSEAEACGNGYRCVGLYAHRMLGFPKSMRAETLAGEIKIEVGKNAVKAKMADPSGWRETVELKGLSFPRALGGNLRVSDPRQKHSGMTGKANERALRVAFVNTGVPHAVIFAEALSKIAVAELGRAVRWHKAFQPKGANVNFVQVTGRNRLAVRTYERGVEDETLACGTGTVASAIAAHVTGRVEKPVQVKTQSGETLKVYFEQAGNKIRNIFLQGNASFVFEGRIGV